MHYAFTILTENEFKNGEKKTELEAIRNKDQVRVLEGHGWKAMYPVLEKELLDYIKKMRGKDYRHDIHD